MSTITLIVCAAPLAHRTQDVVAHLHQEGHTVHVCPTPTAAGEWGVTASPEIPRQPEAVIACPLTFNTLSAWATGLNNSRALGTLNDALGYQTPVLAVPMLADRLTAHPAFTGNIARLTDAGVTFYDLTTGSFSIGAVNGVRSGTGDMWASHFDPSCLSNWLRTRGLDSTARECDRSTRPI